ncbi:hypothetical protein FSP39_018670 [Pinctada imbricata]|uniref:Trafficking protein particle complex subunit 10 n=1 Tax=Pinctada imbricata TaxID=66713 RepID=A0AA88Y5Z6_PINIB|nr:hypothetical protein FSP39_018670 [Pinctada imbricata]
MAGAASQTGDAYSSLASGPTSNLLGGHGDMSLFSTLQPQLLKGLPQESSEWRRSYSRAPKTVYLEASYVPYDEDILPKETDKTLVSRPYFHIFWTCCDLESYKQTVREELAEWTNALKNQNIPDWLIVVVIMDESKVKSKLLPRSSVIDKVRSDFCSKTSDRCIVLSEPLKQDSKSQESWSAFFQRLRSLLLQAFNRHMVKFEENMRTLRENRNDPQWNFTNFFLVQEELAFMFEMLGLYEDALIQYDELDALFTQFVVAHAAGSIIGWLTRFTTEKTNWAGLSLHKSINQDKRNTIKDKKSTLIDLRNYLFSRQCALLFLMDKHLEVAKRAMDFLHNTVQEVGYLQIDWPPGAVDCWVFLSGLEVLQKCDSFTEASQTKSYSLHTASLWDCIRKKLFAVGKLCGLLPESQTSSEQLQLVLELTAGMGIEEDLDDEKPSSVQRPRAKLREALSSKDSFQKIYLELSELAMGTYKHISRFRSARLIGKDLAEFYMSQGNPQKAENFLLDSMKSYHQEGWYQLADAVTLELAECQKLLPNKLKYPLFILSAQVVSSSTLQKASRMKYLDNLMDVSKSVTDSSYTLKTFPMITVDSLSIQEKTILVEQDIVIDIEITCNIPTEVDCDKISLSLKKSLPDIREKQGKRLLSKTDSGGIMKEQVPNFTPIKSRTPNMIEVKSHIEGSPSKPSACSIVCVNTQDVLHRSDSVKSQKRDSLQLKEESSYTLSTPNITLKPGSCSFTISSKMLKPGTYIPNQLCIKIGGLDFIKTLVTDQYFQVSVQDPYCTVKPVKGDKMIAGITQEAILTLNPGSFILEPDDELTLITSSGFKVTTDSGDNKLRVAERVKNGTTEFCVRMFQERSNTIVVEGKLTIECCRFQLPLRTVVPFASPLLLQHKIHTAGTRKYIQIYVEGNTESEFALTDADLVIDNSDVEVTSLNRPNRNMCVNEIQTLSYIWQIKCNTIDISNITGCFTAMYQNQEDLEDTKHKLSYNFDVNNFQTLYTVKVSVTPLSDTKVCKVGSLAIMDFSVVQITNNTDLPQSLVYEIDGSTTMWAVSGKSTGNITLKNGRCDVKMNVMPLQAGYIHVPRITLYKQMQDVWQRQDSKEAPSQPSTDSNDEVFKPEEEVQKAEDEVSNASEDSLTRKQSSREEFFRGQVYYASSAMQVNVYPENKESDIEIELEVEILE